MHTRRMPCENESKDWGDLSTSHGLPNVTSKPVGARREAREDPPIWLSEGTNPANNPAISDFSPPEPRVNTFQLFKLSSLWPFITAAQGHASKGLCPCSSTLLEYFFPENHMAWFLPPLGAFPVNYSLGTLPKINTHSLICPLSLPSFIFILLNMFCIPGLFTFYFNQYNDRSRRGKYFLGWWVVAHCWILSTPA